MDVRTPQTPLPLNVRFYPVLSSPPRGGGEVGRKSVIRYECTDKIRSIFLFRLLFCLSSSGIVQNFGGTLVPGRFLGTFGSYKNSWLRNVGAPFLESKDQKVDFSILDFFFKKKYFGPLLCRRKKFLFPLLSS